MHMGMHMDNMHSAECSLSVSVGMPCGEVQERQRDYRLHDA